MAIYKDIVKKIPISAEKKTKQKQYLSSGVLPIIDQGQKIIGGYTYDISKKIDCDLPVIVFGDHTRCVKLIKFAFAPGADGIKVVRPIDNSVLIEYLFYATKYLATKIRDKGYARHYQDIEKQELEIPTALKQKEIVLKLEKDFSSLDNAIEMLNKTKEQLAVYRQAVLEEEFKEEEKWEQCSLGSLMSMVRNGYGSKPDDCGNYRILTIGSVRAFNLDLNNYRLNNTPFNDDDLIAENDLLFTRYNGNADFVGCCARVPQICEQYAYPDKLIKFRPKLNNIYHSKYLEYFVSHGNARKYLRSKIKTTSGQNGIAGSDIKKLVVFLPTLEKQTEIVLRIEERISRCNTVEVTVNKALQEAEAMRQSILKEAFEGRLV